MFTLKPSVLLVVLLPCLAYSFTISKQNHLKYGNVAHQHGHLPDQSKLQFQGILDRDGNRTRLSTNAGGRIVDITRIEEFPWQVSLQWLDWEYYENWHVCGGFILNERWIGTAAHCISGYEDYPEEYAIISGTNDLRLFHEEHFRFVEQIVTHEDWDWNKLTDDIAWIKVESDLDLNGVTRTAIALPAQDARLPSKKVEIAGWGRIYFEGPLSQMLQSIEIRTLSTRDCKAAYSDVCMDIRTLDKTKICAGLPNMNTCNGDSGGALISRSKGSPVVAGIVSFGVACGEWNHPGVYTRMAYYSDLTSFVISG